MKIPCKKEVKIANCYAIGGMVGLGKSTLVALLAKELELEAVFELDDNDEVQETLLRSMYEGKRVQSPDTFQVDFLLTRALRYKAKIASNKLIIFDRTIFEDLIFAHQNMGQAPHRYHYYQKLWADEVNALVYTYGVPRKYILLDASFHIVKERLLTRGRKVEIDNYEQNEPYFRALHKVYIPFITGILEEYGISYKVIDATKPIAQILALSLQFLVAE